MKFPHPTAAIQVIESELLSFISENDPCEYYRLEYDKDKWNQIRNLLKKRQWVLNDMFSATPDEICRLCSVNDHLKGLSDKLFKRTADLYRLALSNIQSGFDDDMYVEGTLNYRYNGEDSVLELNNDNYYGSSFRSMIALIDRMYDSHIYSKPFLECMAGGNWDKHNEHMSDEELGIHNTLDDGQSWAEGSLAIKALNNVCVCYAVHNIVSHKVYSIPDLLRMNDWWCETKLVMQSITQQDGKRYNPFE